MPLFHYLVEDLFYLSILLEGEDVGPRGHYLLHRGVGRFERPLYHLQLLFGYLPVFVALLEVEQELLHRQELLFGLFHPLYEVAKEALYRPPYGE